MPLPPLSPDTAAAVQKSAHRAKRWAADVEQERISTHDARLRLLQRECEERGWCPDSSYLERELSAETALLHATNTLQHYAPPRFGKILRAGLRRFARLQYLYYRSNHRPEHAVIPPGPGADWPRIYNFFYNLAYPRFSHPEFPVHPSVAIWHAGSQMTGDTGSRGLNGWNTADDDYSTYDPQPASVLVEEDDAVSLLLPFL
ncbi:hypothetical protein GGX14DRAFT_579708 [Mycena pura]|uniref:Uncharacterized protein n=1 Tax=Mycena pura TaxID=153505 RepID=A0AAD6XYD4_9AGAR|nr:hypothetical protein GGX14DRAFT_579708 [Mycena pura]